MPRFVTVKLDMDDLPKLIADSARTCLAAHNIDVGERRLKELGNNVAGSVVITGSAEFEDDRLALWAHLVSEHAGIFSVDLSLEELQVAHEHEHDGPGTIRNHHRGSREYQLLKISKVLSEAEPEDDQYEGSFRAAADNEGHRICSAARDGSDD